MGEAHLTLGALTQDGGGYWSGYPETTRVLAHIKWALTADTPAIFQRSGAVRPRPVRGSSKHE